MSMLNSVSKLRGKELVTRTIEAITQFEEDEQFIDNTQDVNKLVAKSLSHKRQLVLNYDIKDKLKDELLTGDDIMLLSSILNKLLNIKNLLALNNYYEIYKILSITFLCDNNLLYIVDNNKDIIKHDKLKVLMDKEGLTLKSIYELDDIEDRLISLKIFIPKLNKKICRLLVEDFYKRLTIIKNIEDYSDVYTDLIKVNNSNSELQISELNLANKDYDILLQTLITKYSDIQADGNLLVLTKTLILNYHI